MTNTPYPLDRRIEESPLATWRRFLAAGKLAYQVDLTSGQAFFFPRVVAPRTASSQIAWRESAGRGSVHSTTVVYRRNEAPLNVAMIELDEGFRMMSRVEGIDAEAVTIGMRVSVAFREDEGGVRYPVFEAIDAGDDGAAR